MSSTKSTPPDMGDGGSASVTDHTGREINHWNGYQLNLIVDGDAVAIAFPLKT